jgi:hypothetical protein
VGTVKVKGSPNVPVHRRVVLINERSRRIVRETWSDPVTGYAFEGIRGDVAYTTLAYDYTGNYRGAGRQPDRGAHAMSEIASIDAGLADARAEATRSYIDTGAGQAAVLLYDASNVASIPLANPCGSCRRARSRSPRAATRCVG